MDITDLYGDPFLVGTKMKISKTDQNGMATFANLTLSDVKE